MFIVLNFPVVWLYVPLISLVYAQVNAIKYEYQEKNDRCFNQREFYNDYSPGPCSTFTTKNTEINIISFSLGSTDTSQNYYNSYPLGLRIIDSNNRTELSANDFPIRLFQHSRILVLDLSHNNVQKIHPGAFVAFTDLLEVNLTMNFLTTLNNDYLSPLLKLQKINISRNSINTISDTSFANQLDLFVVDLSFNNISHIPNNTFTKQKYLNVLLLQGNRIKQFDLNFHPEPDGELFRLDLSYNLLQTVPIIPEHFTDINLSHNNNITVFSSVVSPKLQSLNLSYNYIKVINPNSFVNASELLKLDLSHNLLTSIPTSSFQNVKKLQYLDLSHNLIQENSYSSVNNWNSFFLNFKELIQIALDGNYWKCSDLKDFIYLITSNRAQLTPGSTHNTTNIQGIGCNSTTNTTSTKEITYNPSERIQSLINQQIGEEFKSLYLNYTTLLALQTVQTNESKIVMESLNSVKAEISKLQALNNSLNTTVNATNMEQQLRKINKSLNESVGSVKTEISKLKVALNSLNTTVNATNMEVNKTLNESVGSVKTEILKLKVALNSLNTTQPNAPKLEDVKTGTSNNELIQIIIKILLDSIKTLNPHPSIAEVKTMEHTQSSSNAGTIITNICLVIAICCIIFFIYVYYKNNKRNVFESERLSLS